MVWFVGHYFCTRVYIKFYKILWGVVCLYKSYKYKYQIYFIYFIKSADWFTHFIGFGHFAPSDCVSTKVGWRPTNILSRQGDSNLASLFFVAAWKITWKTGFKWKTASHPEKSGRQPRSRSDGKTTALEISIGVLCSIKTKFDFFLFHFLRWHKSETLQVRDQTIVLKSVSMNVFTKATFNTKNLLQKPNKIESKSFYRRALFDWDLINLNQSTLLDTRL